MLAEKEYLVGNHGAKVFHQLSGSKQKQLIEFKEAYHELQKDPNKDDVHMKVLAFMGDILKQKDRLKPFG